MGFETRRRDGGQRRRLRDRSDAAFLLAGAGILASVVAPLLVGPLTERAWAAGLLLVGAGMVAGNAGLIGVAGDGRGSASRLATAGAAAATLGGLAAAGVVALAVAAVVADPVLRASLPEPMAVFVALATTMAGGYALGSLLVGLASWRSGTHSPTVSRLLVAGGGVLALPVLVRFLGPVAGVDLTMALLGPVVLFVAVDALAVGYLLPRA